MFIHAAKCKQATINHNIFFRFAQSLTFKKFFQFIIYVDVAQAII